MKKTITKKIKKEIKKIEVPKIEVLKIEVPKIEAPKQGPKLEKARPIVIKPVVIEEDGLTAADFIISEKDAKSERYYEAIGRRKTAVARVRLYTRGDKEFIINNKPYQQYFLHPGTQETATASLKKMKCLDRFRIIVRVKGGGLNAQADAVRHGTARVLVDFNANFRKRLRKAGYLTRDPRMRERKKFGLRRARRAPQWAKR
ncbi:30S ribosomal protein S9 [Patescibacteria group bacterium]|nr:30S ribosomal protein S9 [Patescibacteria group bacterium]